MREASKMMREAKIDTIVQVLTVPVQMYRYLLYLLYRYKADLLKLGW